MEEENGHGDEEKEGNSSIVVRGPVLGGRIDEVEKGNEKTGLEKAEGEEGMELAEGGLVEGGEGGEERVEIAAAEEGEAEELVEGP